MEGNLSMAEQMYHKAYTECSEKLNLSEVDKEYYDGLETSISYNVSRLYEAQKESSKANKIYNQIIKNHPRYLDCNFYFILLYIYYIFIKYILI